MAKTELHNYIAQRRQLAIFQGLIGTQEMPDRGQSSSFKKSGKSPIGLETASTAGQVGLLWGRAKRQGRRPRPPFSAVPSLQQQL